MQLALVSLSLAFVLASCGEDSGESDCGDDCADAADTGTDTRSGQPSTLPPPPTSTGTNQPSDSGPHVLSLSCWALESPCSPFTNEGCNSTAGEFCDIGLTALGNFELDCFPGPNEQTLGEECNGITGPYCETGTMCSSGLCSRACCSNIDCPALDESCVASTAFGNLGVCRAVTNPNDPNNSCAARGDSCIVNGDCCERLCDVDRRCH